MAVGSAIDEVALRKLAIKLWMDVGVQGETLGEGQHTTDDIRPFGHIEEKGIARRSGCARVRQMRTKRATWSLLSTYVRFKLRGRCKSRQALQRV